jgi:hypothetical protein
MGPLALLRALARAGELSPSEAASEKRAELSAEAAQ